MTHTGIYLLFRLKHWCYHLCQLSAYFEEFLRFLPIVSELHNAKYHLSDGSSPPYQSWQGLPAVSQTFSQLIYAQLFLSQCIPHDYTGDRLANILHEVITFSNCALNVR